MRIKNKIFEDKKLRQIGSIAEKYGIRAYLVGGAVRDMLLGKKSADHDIVCSKNPEHVVNEVAKKWNAKLLAHPRFGTFVLTLPNGVSIDFSTARKEKYSFPGALPDVTAGTIEEDMLRRDFTINALAASIDPSDYGKIIDICGGFSDLKKKRLKVLHKGSFKDDPTRIIRLARFFGRGYKIDTETIRLINGAKKYVKNVSRERLGKEIIEILHEKNPYASLELLEKCGIFDKILPGIILQGKNNKLNRARGISKRIVILFGDSLSEKRGLIDSIGLSRFFKKDLKSIISPAKKQPIIKGDTLIAMGYKPGPLFKAILEQLSKKRFKSRRIAKQFVFDNFPINS